MKILIAHNEYGIYSGEEASVGQLSDLFTCMGHDVSMLKTSTSAIRDTLSGKISTAVSSIYCKSGRKLMKQYIREFEPDIINIHNIFPFIGHWALMDCKEAGIPVVMRVHNYRLMCPNGLFFSSDRGICEECLLSGNNWPCIKHNCTQSFPKSIVYAVRNSLSSGFYRKYVNMFVCLTEFQKSKLIRAGFDANRITVIPHHAEFRDYDISSKSNGNYVGVVGRLSFEKGIDMIIEVARCCPDIQFKIAGGGSMASDLVKHNLPNIEWCGHLSKEQLSNFYKSARFIVMCSRCYEGQPMVMLEAASLGLCSLVPSFPSFMECSSADSHTVYTAYDLDSMLNKVRFLWNDVELCRKLGEEARRNLISKYNIKLISHKWNLILNQLVKKQQQF